MLNTHIAPPAAKRSASAMPEPSCRLCGARLLSTLIDFGALPLANRTLAAHGNDDPCYRLHARICDICSLVQVADVATPEALAPPLPYLSSRSAFRLNQAHRHAEAMMKRLHLGTDSLVIEVGSNDGYLLRQFRAAAIPVLGIECAPSAAAAAAALGIPTEIALFNTAVAMDVAVQHGRADLVVANNVLPHVPDLFDFVAGLASILRPNGMISLQVPHLLSLVQNLYFDGFRHDVYTYLSLRVLEHVLRSVGLRVFDAERLPDHGGSLRVYACHGVGPHPPRPGLKLVRQAERSAELDRRDFYTGFNDRVASAKDEIAAFLRNRRAGGRRIAAYGATARGSTLLNCCGMTTNEIPSIADADPAKHGRLLPGSRIPIVPLETLLADPPDDVLILPWPNAKEIARELAPLRQHGTQLWTPVPRIARI